jgi:hypothetical protein
MTEKTQPEKANKVKRFAVSLSPLAPSPMKDGKPVAGAFYRRGGFEWRSDSPVIIMDETDLPKLMIDNVPKYASDVTNPKWAKKIPDPRLIITEVDE